MRTIHDFYLAHEGEKLCQKEIKKLFPYLALLENKKMGDQFAELLATKFFGGDARLAPLFRALFQKFLDPNAKFLRVSTLLQKLYDRDDVPENFEEEIRSLLKKIPGLIQKFQAYRYLNEEKAELMRLQALTLKNTEHEQVYATTVRKWEKTAAKLPLGRGRSFHICSAADAAHFSFTKEKTEDRPKTFAKTEKAWLSFSELQQSFYKCETKVQRSVFGTKLIEPSTTPPPKDQLTQLYSDLDQLLEGSNEVQLDQYQACKNGFLGLASSLDTEQRLSLFLLIQNFLAVLNRHPVNPLSGEPRYWTQYAIEHNLFGQLKSLSKQFFLNRLHSALAVEDVPLAKKVVSIWGPLVPGRDRKGILLHAAIAIAFFSHDYAGVLKMIKSAQKEAWKDRFLDDVRLKSYRVRAVLCLFIRNHASYQETEKVLNDFDKYLERNGQLHSEGQLESLHNFKLFCWSVFRAAGNSNLLSANYSDLKTLLLSLNPILAKNWLCDFLWQIFPGRRPRPVRIEPSAGAGSQRCPNLK